MGENTGHKQVIIIIFIIIIVLHYICINHIYKSASKDIYNITKYLYFKQMLFFELSIQKILFEMFPRKHKAAQLFSTLTLNKYFLISKSAY